MVKSKTAIVYPKVKIGSKSIIEDYAVIGKKPQGVKKVKVLKIGSGAIIRTGTILYSGSTIGDNFQTGDYCRVRENNLIGNNVSIGANSHVERDSRIGNNVRVHSLCFIPEYTILEDNVWMGPGVTITNVVHPPCPIFKERGHEMELKCLRGPLIRKGAIIGARTILLPGVEIGERAFVAAGSVVTKDVKPDTVVVGSPARRTKKIKDLICDPGIFEKGEIYSWREN
ncbi:MAG: DapH/DapD/GlmU-related protein [Nitrosopumilaceae archaeon]